MKSIRIILSSILALVLCLTTALPAGASGMSVYQTGDSIADFTITTYDGQSITLSEVLAEKDMVLINIWASWCGPCRSEFPYMEEAYQQYKDQVEILALSCEETDTDDKLRSFADELGLTFPVGRDTANLASLFAASSIPTSVVVDRNGVICYIEAGAMPDAASFARLFDAFVGEEYSEPLLLNGLPPMKPTAEPASEKELSAALNAEGASLSFTNDPDKYVWPMTIAQEDDRTAVVSSNTGVHGSTSAVHAAVPAKAGDAIAVTFKTSTEAAFDALRIKINGETVKSFTGEHDWTTYAWPVVADGEYAVSLIYEKTDDRSSAGADKVLIDTLAVLTGEPAQAALAANPFYPQAEESTITPLNGDAQEIVIDDPNSILTSYFPNARYFILHDEQAEFAVRLSAEIDPETALGFSDYDRAILPAMEQLQGEIYRFPAGTDSIATTGYAYSTYMIYPDPVSAPALTAVYFADEPNADAFVSSLYGESGSWQYAEPEAPAADQPALSGPSSYTLTFVDQNGDPVPGVMAQVCNDALCMVYFSDEKGVCSFELDPYAYEIHLLKLPEGYEGDTEGVVTAPVEGGELKFELKKN